MTRRDTKESAKKTNHAYEKKKKIPQQKTRTKK